MKTGHTKHYFVSDVHLGLHVQDPREREEAFVRWLVSIQSDAAALYLLGDIFDFWWEYKYVVPKGHTRTLGALAQLADSGVQVHFFRGNHDYWTFGYLESELGLQLHEQPYDTTIGGRRFCMGHGDGLGPADAGSRILKAMFGCGFLQRCFSAVHPRWGWWFGHRWSRHNRLNSGPPYIFRGDKDPLYIFALEAAPPADYFIFGHLHTPVQTDMPSGAQFIILGDWMHHRNYGVFDEESGQFFVKSLFL